ncbi:MAG: hypothetical protein WA700_13550 [Acidobacteriaceae bacterium]
MPDYETRRQQQILAHPNATPEQKAAARKYLAGKDVPNPVEAPVQVPVWDSAFDGELENYLTRPTPPRHEQPDNYWRSMQDTSVGRVFLELKFGGLLGRSPEQAKASIEFLLPVLTSTRSKLIRNRVQQELHSILYLEKDYQIPESLRAQALVALEKHADRFPENGQVEVTDGR